MPKVKKSITAPKETKDIDVDDLVVSSTDRQEIQRQSPTVTAYAESLTISNDTEYAAAGAYVVEVINKLLVEADRIFDDNIKRWYQGHRSAIADKKKEVAPLLAAKKAIDDTMYEYRKQKKRLEAQQQRQIAAAMQQAAEDEAVEKVARLIEDGKDDEAAQLTRDMERGEVVPITPLPPMVHKKPAAEGISVRNIPRFRILDDSKIKREFLIPDERKIAGVVRAMRKEAEKLIGEGSIEYYETESMGSRRG